ncbi:IS30 family transposase [Amphibacillus sp. Q70]|uniref:IS30 family transposase n=1 Tax=Amphibacillus sp. Q70 TaxID=3453416 RepID=UPI003F876285
MTHVNTITESRKGKHLTFAEMKQIEAYKKLELSNRAIGRLLDRNYQTINNNVKKGTVTQVQKQTQNGKSYFYERAVYFADVNYDVYEKNRSHCGRRPKWVDGHEFVDWADQKMRQDKWSPDVVVNVAKSEAFFHESIIPSTSTLYHWIDSGIMQTKNMDLLEKVDRKPRSTKGKGHRNKKVHGISIEERPESVNQRKEFGHWEIDTVIGKKKADEPVLLTLVERKTTFELLFKIDGKRATQIDDTLQHMISQLNGIEGDIFKTITSDNGSEFSNLSELSKEIDVYYCHPYASFERGTSENQHKIIRRFLPKHESLKDVNEDQVKRVQQWMNDYPRRNQNYKTPHQAFVLELQKLQLNLVA